MTAEDDVVMMGDLSADMTVDVFVLVGNIYKNKQFAGVRFHFLNVTYHCIK